MNEIKIFENPNFGKIRTLEIEGEPWFIGKDVAEALGYVNTKDALISHVDNEDKRIIQRSEIATIENNIPKSALPINFVSAEIPNRGLTAINESGLYSLVLSSKLPTAKAFKRWITSEVIPSIRKHGAYMTPDELEDILLNPDTLITLATELKKERAAREHLEGLRRLAKLLKQNGVEIGQNRLFEWLRNNGFLISRKGSDYNMPTQKAMEMGLFEIKETAIPHSDGHITVSLTPKVSGKGQKYFVNRFLQGVKQDV